jgi:Leucine rich repeat
LVGSLPVELAELRRLEVLDLQNNELVGQLPAAWGVLSANGSSLESMRLDANRFTGTIPNEWCQMNSTSLRELILARNNITGTIPSCLSKLAAMEDFSVMHNSMTGRIPDELGELSKLQTIHLAGNYFDGQFPSSVCDLDDDALYEASADCLNILSDRFVQCSCCTKCCDGGDETCELKSDIQERFGSDERRFAPDNNADKEPPS